MIPLSPRPLVVISLRRIVVLKTSAQYERQRGNAVVLRWPYVSIGLALYTDDVSVLCVCYHSARLIACLQLLLSDLLSQHARLRPAFSSTAA